MNFEPEFLDVSDVLEIHADQLIAYGGSPGIRAQSLLESAVSTPKASFGGEYVHRTVFEMAAAYAFHIAENQPFVDGNKRTGLAAALVFLDFHEIGISEPNDELFQAMIDISARRLDKAGLALLFENLQIK